MRIENDAAEGQEQSFRAIDRKNEVGRMKLIIGGAFQGKLAYAKRQYQIEDGWADGENCTVEELESCRGINHFHELVRRMVLQKQNMDSAWELSAEKDAESFAEHLSEVNPDIVIISNELGCGIVPMDPTDREFRETAGRICTALAARSDEVVRVVCGIGMVLRRENEE